MSQSAFYVQAIPTNVNNITSFFHEQSSLASACQVTAAQAQTANAEIYCILDAAELDLYTTKFDLNFNAPGGMCAYTSVRPYAFYYNEPGDLGAFTMTMTVDGTTGAVSGCSTNPVSLAGASCTVGGTGPIGLAGAAPVCQYNYNSLNPAGPNCCSANITLTTNHINPAAAPTTGLVSIGGKPSNCLVGPGKDVNPGVDSNGNPLDFLFFTKNSGVNMSYKIGAPIDLAHDILYNTNFWDPSRVPAASGNTTFSETWLPTIVHTTLGDGIPQAMNPFYASAATGIKSQTHASPFYEFECLDEAADTIARIRVLVRAWDQMAFFGTLSSGGLIVPSAAAPYNNGTFEQFPFNDATHPNHDKSVWQDLNNVYGDPFFRPLKTAF